ILEVKARIKSIFRRAQSPQPEANKGALVVRNMTINLNNRSVSINGEDVNLTAKEFDLLQLFVANRGKVFSRENLLETIWKYEYLGDLRTVDVHIRRLREKIEKNPAQPEFILTKWGVGYYFTDKD
ncbi:MAG: response regulator transcription factor, partial [Clostridiales bacterium]|nr:response regulator transcription factor [Clostridiales bacterium]